MYNNFNILVTGLGRISDYSGWKMLPGDITICLLYLEYFFVINLKPCLNLLFNVGLYIYIYAVQLTPLALQGALHHYLSGKSILSGVITIF